MNKIILDDKYFVTKKENDIKNLKIQKQQSIDEIENQIKALNEQKYDEDTKLCAANTKMNNLNSKSAVTELMKLLPSTIPLVGLITCFKIVYTDITLPTLVGILVSVLIPCIIWYFKTSDFNEEVVYWKNEVEQITLKKKQLELEIGMIQDKLKHLEKELNEIK